MITLGALFVYPIKSCHGIALERARLTATGLAHDREWMVVSPEGRFLTQRDTPRLALVVPTIEPEALTLEAPGMTPLTVPFEAPNEFSPLPLRRGFLSFRRTGDHWQCIEWPQLRMTRDGTYHVETPARDRGRRAASD